MYEPEHSINRMELKNTNTISAMNKMKELETTTNPLVQELDSICKSKVIETYWEILWKEVKKWSYKDGKMIEEAQKVNASTILGYINAPLMEHFVGTKDIITQFIVI